ncbi:MAG: sigma-70 family RNA polymerase sigma factor [Clostridia bacterium]
MENAEAWPVQLHPTREAILQTWMSEHGEKVLHFIYLTVKDRHLAEDLTQTVFLKAYRSLDSFRGECSPKTWLYKIALNETRSYLTSWAFRHLFATMSEKVEELLERGNLPDVETEVVERLDRQEIARLVMSLQPRHRQIIVLHYYEDLTLREIAELIEVTEDNVRTRLHRARKQLRQLLEGRRP